MNNLLDNDQISEQERIVVAMGAIACLMSAQTSPDLQDLTVTQVVPTEYIARLLGIETNVVRAALQNAEELGICSYYSEDEEAA